MTPRNCSGSMITIQDQINVRIYTLDTWIKIGDKNRKNSFRSIRNRKTNCTNVSFFEFRNVCLTRGIDYEIIEKKKDKRIRYRQLENLDEK